MKRIFSILLLLSSLGATAQVDSITIPPGVKYKYCKPEIFEKAKQLATAELGAKPKYKLINDIMFVGPTLWSRYKKVKELSSIEGGNLIIMVDDTKLSGKLTQTQKDGKKFWDQIRKEVDGKDYKLRKATEQELIYYWAVISFDIEEPLMILETSEHRYILNLSTKDFTILWLDEVPSKVPAK